MRDPACFSRRVLGMRLYEYQLAPLRAVTASVLDYRGREFLLVFPRQSGKNEVLAHLLVYLLNVLQRAGGNIVYAAIGDGLGRGVQRLEARLDNPLNRGEWRAGAGPTRRMLGQAAVVFLSSHPQAYSRGETAHWLLVDWLQAALPGRVTAFKFTALSKAQLGSHFLAVVETGRFRYRQEAEPLTDGWWFWQQVTHCSYELPPGGSWERQLRWFVPAGATVETAVGRQKVHDDRLLSAALVALYDELYRSGALPVGQAESAIIPPRDPLAHVRF